MVGIVESASTLTLAYAVIQENKALVKAEIMAEAETLAAKQEALANFVRENDLAGVPCTYVLDATHYSLNLVDAPAVAKDEVSRAIRWLIKDSISYPIEEAVIDTFELPFVRAKDSMKMIYAVAMQKALIPKIEELISNSGLVLTYIDIPELVLKNIISRRPPELKSCALVQLWEKGGKIILCRGDEICITRSFELKLENLGKEPEQDSGTLESLALEVQRSFDYINSVFKQSIQNTILLAPTKIDKELIAQSLKNSLGSEVYPIKITEYLTIEKPIAEEKEPAFLLAIAASLRQGSVAL